MNRIVLAAVAACIGTSAWAQQPVYNTPGGQPANANVNLFVNGSNQAVPVTSLNPLPVAGFTPATTGTPISVTTGGVTGALPAGAVVVATNVGTTNGAFCKLGGSSTTSDQFISPNGGWFAFTVGAATQLTCITSTSTTTVNMVGGAGLPTGTGGGGGGGSGGGGPVTAALGSYADGAITTLGTQADSVCATATGTCTLEALVKFLNSSVTSAIPAGTNLIGDVNLRQGGTALSATNGGFSNLLQGNAVLSATNGVFANQLQGNAVLSVTNPTFTQTVPGATGGLTSFFVQPTASDNHAVLKNGAGQVYHVSVTNNSATVNYLRLYNAGTGFNGCNSATNLVGQWAIPASTSVGGITFPFPEGMAFSTGISICVTSGYATTDTTAATASAMSVNVGFK